MEQDDARPRDLTEDETMQIFYFEKDLRELYSQDLYQKIKEQQVDPDPESKQLQQEEIFYNTLIIDKVHLKFCIEPEDFRLGVDKYDLYNNPEVLASLQEFPDERQQYFESSEEAKRDEIIDDSDEFNDRIEETLNFEYSKDLITMSLLDDTV